MYTLKPKAAKTAALLFVFSALTFSVSATQPTSSKSTSKTKSYVMVRHGKLIEVSHGHRTAVKRNIILTNESTLHPDGSIDAGSGESLKLKEGQYITMDGRIGKVKDLKRHS
jgi:hypothetical protein